METIPYQNYNLRTPYFSKAQLEQIYRYAYIMGYTFEIREDEYNVINGKSHILWNEDKSSYVFLQSGKDGLVNTIYKSFKTCLTHCLISAEFFLVRNGKPNALDEINVNDTIFNLSRELYDIDTFVIKRNKKYELSANKRSDIHCNNNSVSSDKNLIQTSTT